MMLIKELRLKSEEDMFKLAEEIANELAGKEVICLKGNLGAGKTTFVKGLAKAMGIEKGYQVRSPTFTLVNEYPTKRGKLIHIDLYRVKDFDYTELIGEGIIAVEWEEKNNNCNYVIEIEIIGENERLVKVFKK
ncbi:MAG TPA: tRNA (adenosine(37)-N6)-threonylcarbamoyltransferase complex ATPase subunit type 1 TsaE [Aquificaceae bacterium]|nr:tRNA (adenosine(37)-N6)-threonylcarbamoyltransferase complex ATPase subunit type 1 TsaE [Aquificaceae bacterium]